MVTITRQANAYNLVAPASSNQAYKVLRDLGRMPARQVTDLRQQAMISRGSANSLIEMMQAQNSVEEARALQGSETVSLQRKDAIDAAANRITIVSALNNQRDTRLLKANAGSSAGAAIANMLKASLGRTRRNRRSIILSTTLTRAQSRKMAPLDIIASDVKGPKFGGGHFRTWHPAPGWLLAEVV